MSIELITCLTTYLLIILAELGDKTQLAILLVTSNNPRKRWTIFGASALALTACVLVEVTIGTALARVIGINMINRISGAVFLAIGIIGLFSIIQKPSNPRVPCSKQSSL
ncbi:TMEM165/GDT1 family protein [Syntrophomonas palmitatica]|uniref:TMEM165/GDT1 family protein n=1 Tax=Syntrophomonas palmitatica TaxID=402877 RepID=UPI0006D1B0C5|nr:TMEM165/GDT1 family protein [Syntrophomonas palmitatica]